MKRKGFTLIELIVTLVILAIIGLIAIPIVINIIDKAKESANRENVRKYVHVIEIAQSEYKLEYGHYADNIKDLNIKYNGINIQCDEIELNNNGSVYVNKCKIDDIYIEDDKSEDGYYHYGSRDSFLYKTGDLVIYNDMKFYVVKSVSKKSPYVTLLKATSLTIDEVNTYGSGYVNNYNTEDGNAYAYDNYRGAGGMKWYYKKNCGVYKDESGYHNDYSGCKNSYIDSDVKKVVDNWAQDKIKSDDLVEDSMGYKARLITYEELAENFDYISFASGNFSKVIGTKDFEEIMRADEDWYWTMSQYYDYENEIWIVSAGHLTPAYINGNSGASVRPVINVKVSAIEEA